MGYGGTILIPRSPHEVFTIIRVIKSRRIRWAGLVARIDDMRDAYNTLVGKPERKSTGKNEA
jgi:hypothetical protein